MLLFTQLRPVGFALSITKMKTKKYINFCEFQNSAIAIVPGTSSPLITEMDGKPISGRGYRSCFNYFLLNIHCPNEIIPVGHSDQD